MTSFTAIAFILLLALWALPLLLGFLSGRAYREGRGRVALGLLLLGVFLGFLAPPGPLGFSSSSWACFWATAACARMGR
jgi:hypothetical protein